MNIIIPVGGIGKRFSDAGYIDPKPLINILGKKMIQYVLGSLDTTEDYVFVIYNNTIDFNELVQNYPKITFIPTNPTRGAAETILNGITEITKKYQHHDNCLILDCDTYYNKDIQQLYRESSEKNVVFFTKNTQQNPIYSYIKFSKNSNKIFTIQEKIKISDNANTGAYGFKSITILKSYAESSLQNSPLKEYYISYVIFDMLADGISFYGISLEESDVISFGTPDAVRSFLDSRIVFLFDLDGTLVRTDSVYFEVWKEILEQFNIILTTEIFNMYIRGNNDTYVVTNLLNNHIPITEISVKKDSLLIKHIDKIQVIKGVYHFIDTLKKMGHSCCIVTNCNSVAANAILEYVGLVHQMDFIISSNDCVNGKPHPEGYLKAMERYAIPNTQCIIFEDSKPGIMSAMAAFPRELVGVQSIYTEKELNNLGINRTIIDYSELSIEELINNNTKNDIDYITESISDALNIPVTDIRIQSGKLKGGYIASIIGFTVLGERGSPVSRVPCTNSEYILKYENENVSDLSRMADILKLYEREYYFYNNISEYINVNIPKYISTTKTGIILENLIIKGYTPNLNLNTQNIDVSLKIISEMAKMHAKFWGKDLLQTFPGLKKTTDKIFNPFLSTFVKERLRGFKSRWSCILTNKQLKYISSCVNNFSDIQKRLAENNLTIIHGDIKSANIFYDTVNGNVPYFLDWQHSGIGKGVQDLIFFLIESFDGGNIEINMKLFENYYYRKLIEFGITNYSYSEYIQDIKDALSYIPLFTSIWFGTVPVDNLIDKNFPYFFISKMVLVMEHYLSR
jgi:HAD superfamily hydrolase (TIGR01509 family)